MQVTVRSMDDQVVAHLGAEPAHGPPGGSGIVGTVLTDDGRVLDVAARALRGSGFRRLRPGQRLTATVDDAGVVESLRLIGLGSAASPGQRS